jgi:hypothetical protein
MDKYKRLAEALRAAVAAPTLPLITAEVKSVEGESCTVTVGELELTDVRLKTAIDGKGESLLVTPVVGSIVLLGSLTGDLKDLAVLRVDQPETIAYEQAGLKVLIDSKDGKISVENSSVSLKGLFQSLSTLLKGFKVMTPAGPSTNLIPDTQLAVERFETDFKQLLK